MRTQNKEQGVALITVMLILALATILAVSMSSQQRLDIHRSSNIFDFEQAYQYVLGAEGWAIQVLKRDLKANKTDSSKDDWATVLPALPIEGGQMVGEIEDLQSRFNINNLVKKGKPQKIYIERFKRLLRNLNLNEDMSSVIIDWIDANEVVVFLGAEDNDYLNSTPAYRASNQAMQDSSELLLLKDIDFDAFEKLRPYICVLKSGTPINVNTASAEVLSSIVNGMSLEDAKTLVAERKKSSYENINKFLDHPLVKNRDVKAKGLSVSSNYFQLNPTVQINRISVDYTSVIWRKDVATTRVLRRSRGVL